MQNFDLAKKILSENAKIQYGIFGIIESSGFFPPRPFLNEFLLGGNDPCDQDGRMENWKPFSLSSNEYVAIKEWWISNHPETVEDSFGVESWNNWMQKILGNLENVG